MSQSNNQSNGSGKFMLFGAAILGIGCLPAILFIGLMLFFSSLIIFDDDDNERESYGAVCRVDGEIDYGAFSEVFINAGVFYGMESTFIRIANEYGIDPVLMAAIAMHETGYGKSTAVVEKNNPGGLMNPATGSRELYVFSSLEEGLQAMGKTLHNRIVKDGLNTIEKLGQVYAPVGAANDPNGSNVYWIPNVAKIANDLGGLIMNCEDWLEGVDRSDTTITISGNAALQAIVDEMLKYEGWSYVWGGYNPSMGFDCSGLIQWAYKQSGIHLPRTSYQQYLYSTPILKSQLQPGDLVFFKTASYAPVTHVGVYLGDGLMYNSNNSGVKFDNVFDGYWGARIVGYGRVADFSTIDDYLEGDSYER